MARAGLMNNTIKFCFALAIGCVSSVGLVLTFGYVFGIILGIAAGVMTLKLSNFGGLSVERYNPYNK